jgi:hypothetical protein
MNRCALPLLVAASFVLPASSASAAILEFGGSLSGLSETTINNSPGSGLAHVTVDDVLMTMRVEVTFQDLLGLTTASHIHCCAAANNTAMVATELPSFTGFPLGVQSGTYDHTFDMSLAAAFNPAFVTAHGGTVEGAFDALIGGMMTNTAYLNIHTNLFPAGEIRAQLSPVPEMSTWAMLILGFGALGLAFRRARKAIPAAA